MDKLTKKLLWGAIPYLPPFLLLELDEKLVAGLFLGLINPKFKMAYENIYRIYVDILTGEHLSSIYLAKMDIIC